MAHTNIPLSQDAALVVALAGTAMPFARSAEDEAERWLRTLRLHGEVGAALQALGVGEAALAPSRGGRTEPAPSPPLGALDEVGSRARLLAAARGANSVATGDLLFAVIDVYGGFFERALLRRGCSRAELLDRLAAERPGAATDGPGWGEAGAAPGDPAGAPRAVRAAPATATAGDA